MSDKEIINGIDVSECCFYNNGKCNNPNGMSCNCINNAVCYFKELKRLQEENEKLKEYIKDLQVRKDRYYLQVLEFERQISDWVTFYMKISNIVSGNYEILDSKGLQDLRQIISEVVK